MLHPPVKAGWLEDPLDLGHPAGGDDGAELASEKCGGLDAPMVGGDATPMGHKEQREGQPECPTPQPSPTNNPKQEGEPSIEVPKDTAPESDQGDEEVVCYAMEAELKSLD